MKKTLFKTTLLFSILFISCNKENKVVTDDLTTNRQPVANNISMTKELDSLYNLISSNFDTDKSESSLETLRNTIIDKYANTESLYDFIPDENSFIKSVESKDRKLKIFSWKTTNDSTEDYDHIFVWNINNKVDFKSDFSKKDNKHTIKTIHQFDSKNKTYYVVQTSTKGEDFKENKLISFEISNNKLVKIPLFKENNKNLNQLEVSAKTVDNKEITDDQLITVNEATIKIAKKSGPYLNNDYDTYIWNGNFFVKQ